ncbi:MAG: hypothetical protein PGN07_04635 [Aeromicrobium erythreum]
MTADLFHLIRTATDVQQHRRDLAAIEASKRAHPSNLPAPLRSVPTGPDAMGAGDE